MKKTLFLILIFMGSNQLWASSSFEIRTNEEMKATLDMALKTAGYESAVTAVSRDEHTGTYIVRFSGKLECTESYEPDRGNTEAEGLKSITLVKSTCKKISPKR